MPVPPRLADLLKTVQPTHERFATEAVEALLADARDIGASDVHLIPRDGGKRVEILWRIDGVLQPCADVPQAATNLITRLKVLAQLLTYKTEIPQEGRLREEAVQARGKAPIGSVSSSLNTVEMRLGTFPTVHGEKAVVRLFNGTGGCLNWEDLHYPPDQDRALKGLIHRTSGLLLVTGPAGSGKTTTLYAALRELVNAEIRRSVCTLEDPVESILPGVAQSQLRPAAGFDYATGLRSLMRQDPEVVLVGEIRDPEAAEAALQLSLTGCLVLSTFHAGRAVEAVSRLTEMGIEPYVLRSSLNAILNQRLLRKLCDCKTDIVADRSAIRSRAEDSLPTAHPNRGAISDFWGLPIQRGAKPVGCEKCRQTGYLGRQLVAELLLPDEHRIARDILNRTDADEMEEHALAAGFRRCFDRAVELAEAGITSPAEVRRIYMMLK